MGWLDWNAGPGSHNTNKLYLTSPEYAVLAKFSGNAWKIYKCPADRILSAGQRRLGWSERVRSISANGAVGQGNKSATDGLLNCAKLFIKTTDVTAPTPSKLWVFVDEHPDSINDGAFFNAQNDLRWIDLPANYHNNACGFAFADGHSEIQKWKTSVTRFPVREGGFQNGNKSVARNDIDWNWTLERTSAPR